MRRLLIVSASILLGLGNLLYSLPVQAASVRSQNVCSAITGMAMCQSKARIGTSGYPLAVTAPAGLGPDQLRSAYEIVGKPGT